ncbi:hypothetical protein G6F35_009743 [Rhizopus arrhizus]|nr:hypothetical protein G6F35_009743 [Rhizopus arrhizus]
MDMITAGHQRAQAAQQGQACPHGGAVAVACTAVGAAFGNCLRARQLRASPQLVGATSSLAVASTTTSPRSSPSALAHGGALWPSRGARRASSSGNARSRSIASAVRELANHCTLGSSSPRACSAW